MANPYLREGVDVYIEQFEKDISTVVFVFLSTRKRIQLRICNSLVAAIPLFDGKNSVDDILIKTDSTKNDLINFISYLESNGLILPKNWLESINLTDYYKTILEKQLYFLMDILNSPQAVSDLQNRILKTKTAIFGMGATGSWMLIELLQMGFTNFKIYDFKNIAADSISRHAFFDITSVGKSKVLYYTNIAHKINPLATVEFCKNSIKTDKAILKGLNDIDLIINCADEPYIGYTSIMLSRYSVQHDKLLFVAGGFDAHLGCLGELIVPRKTPCSDCYNEYFKEALKDWKPVSHPVTNRFKGFGGLAGLSVFSASNGALTILRYFINEKEFLESAGGRGEFKFHDYQIDAFKVTRNLDCGVCRE